MGLRASGLGLGPSLGFRFVFLLVDRVAFSSHGDLVYKFAGVFIPLACGQSFLVGVWV